MRFYYIMACRAIPIRRSSIYWEGGGVVNHFYQLPDLPGCFRCEVAQKIRLVIRGKSCCYRLCRPPPEDEWNDDRDEEWDDERDDEDLG